MSILPISITSIYTTSLKNKWIYILVGSTSISKPAPSVQSHRLYRKVPTITVLSVEIPTRSLPFFWYLLLVSLLVRRASLCKHGLFSSIQGFLSPQCSKWDTEVRHLVTTLTYLGFVKGTSAGGSSMTHTHTHAHTHTHSVGMCMVNKYNGYHNTHWHTHDGYTHGYGQNGNTCET